MFKYIGKFHLVLILPFNTAMAHNSGGLSCQSVNDFRVHYIPYIKSSRKVVCYPIVSKDLSQFKNRVPICSCLCWHLAQGQWRNQGEPFHRLYWTTPKMVQNILSTVYKGKIWTAVNGIRFLYLPTSCLP